MCGAGLSVYVRGCRDLKGGKCEFSIQHKQVLVNMISCGIPLVDSNFRYPRIVFSPSEFLCLERKCADKCVAIFGVDMVILVALCGTLVINKLMIFCYQIQGFY